MRRYANLSGDSGVVAYDTGADFIDVQFVDGWIYRYSHASAGPRDVAAMKSLALAGRGLSGFIARHVGKHYESKRPAAAKSRDVIPARTER